MLKTEKIKVLIVDDDEMMCQRLGDLLEADNFQTYLAANGESGLEIVEKKKPDVVVCDIHMPGMSGIELVKEIKKKTNSTEVIIITGQNGIETALAAIKEGVFGYLLKPIDIDELEIDIFRAFEKVKTDKELGVKLKELRQAVADRNQEINHRKKIEADLQKSRHEAETATIAKSQFLANMSHEIRTPISGIIGISDLAISVNSIEKLKYYFEMIKISAHSLQIIVNDILDLSKIEAHKIQLENTAFVLSKCLTDVIEPLALTAGKKKVRFVLEVDPFLPLKLVGDEGKFKQILTNIIGNAVKFTEQGEICIHAGFHYSQDRQTFLKAAKIYFKKKMLSIDKIIIHVSVSDTGIGIANEKQKMIFENFTQGDVSTSRLYGGSGLGLAITKQLIQLMKGRINVKSKPGKGSVFAFGIPFAADLSGFDQWLGKKQSLKNTKILVVSANQSLINSLRLLLNFLGTDIEKSENISQCLKVLVSLKKSKLPDLIILDAKLPWQNGLKAAEKISQLYKISLGMLVPSGMIVSDEEINQAGLSGCLSIPCSNEKFVDFLEKLLLSAEFTGNNADFGKMDQAANDSKVTAQIGLKKQLKILVAEDDPIAQAIVLELSVQCGYHLDVVSNGAEAVRKVKIGKYARGKCEYDLILLDMEMPVMNGRDAAIEIRSILHHEKVPLVALTAHQINQSSHFSEEGFADCIIKPLNYTKFINVIEKYFRSSNMTITSKTELGEAPQSNLGKFIAVFKSPIKQIEMLDGLQKTIEQSIADLMQLIEMQNYEQIARVAHRLKGTLSYFHKQELNDCLKNMEYAAFARAINEIIREFLFLKPQLAEFLKEIYDFKNKMESLLSG